MPVEIFGFLLNETTAERVVQHIVDEGLHNDSPGFNSNLYLNRHLEEGEYEICGGVLEKRHSEIADAVDQMLERIGAEDGYPFESVRSVRALATFISPFIQHTDQLQVNDYGDIAYVNGSLLRPSTCDLLCRLFSFVTSSLLEPVFSGIEGYRFASSDRKGKVEYPYSFVVDCQSIVDCASEFQAWCASSVRQNHALYVFAE